MADKLPYIQFFTRDWLADEVANCSLAAQGLWLRMMIVMHDSDRYGYICKNGVPVHPDLVAKRCGTNPDEYATLLAELDRHGVPRRSDNDIIYSKRMVEDHKKRQKRRKNGELGGNPALNQMVNHLLIYEVAPMNSANEDANADSEKGVQGERVRCPAVLNTPEFRESWDAWGKHRQSIHRPLTWSMIRAQLKQMEKMGVARSIAMLDHTVSRGWWGLREPDEPRNGFATQSSAPAPRRQPAKQEIYPS